MNKEATSSSGNCPDALNDWNIGDRVYFVKNGCIDTSMKVMRIEEKATAACEVTTHMWNGCLIFMDDLRQEQLEQIKGFQGFRYRWW